MRTVNRQTTEALRVPRTRRNHPVAVLTSAPAGKFWPVKYIPMLREDALDGRLTVKVEMLETKELLMNPTFMRVRAFCVPHLALERFEGSRDQFDRSYMGEPKVAGGAVVPFIETAAMGTHGANAVYKALGLHGKSTDLTNTAILESYNDIVNWLRRNVSPDLPMRSRLEATLAPAFWLNSRFEHVVPDFDQAVIDGEVALSIAAGGTELTNANVIRKNNAANTLFKTAGANTVLGSGTITSNVTTGALVSAGSFFGSIDPNGGLEADLSGVLDELVANGVTISLSNLEMARKTQAFAKVREKYGELPEEYLIDMAMSGLSFADQDMKQPFQVSRDIVVPFRQAKRYATDAGNLAESAVSGAAEATFRIRVPRLEVGGVVMVVVECLPDQLFEREKDWYFHTQASGANSWTAWPDYLRDTLDPEKVDVVTNGMIDTDHATPAATFGYEPLNAKLNRQGPTIGGKFYRPTANTTTDDARQRLWSMETVNPTLSADFYLASTVHQKPFLDTEVDPFEASVVGDVVIEGNTVFGGVLVEATNNYDEVAAKAPTARIEKEA